MKEPVLIPNYLKSKGSFVVDSKIEHPFPFPTGRELGTGILLTFLTFLYHLEQIKYLSPSYVTFFPACPLIHYLIFVLNKLPDPLFFIFPLISRGRMGDYT